MQQLIESAVQLGATDIHLEEGECPRFRRGHRLEVQASRTCTPELMDALARVSGMEFWRANTASLDASFSAGGVRLRAHLFSANQRRCATLRVLPAAAGDLEGDKDAKLLRHVSQLKEGLVLITGPTSSGKSYTLAMCLSFINRTREKHIITLEDPVEFRFVSDQSLIHQRQLGEDVVSMAAGVRDALREDPDIIMIGELRDRDTLEAALHAAETGHLVFATMHTQRAVMAINRMLSMFPAEQQEEVRSQLSQVLRAVICQRLVVMDSAFVIARDILINSPAVANLIRQRKEPQITSIQETQTPMRTMEMAVQELRAEWGARKELEEVLESSYEMV